MKLSSIQRSSLYRVVSIILLVCAVVYLYTTYITVTYQQEFNESVQNFYTDITNSRKYAIEQNQTVSVCARIDGACSTHNNADTWNKGWIAYTSTTHNKPINTTLPSCQPGLKPIDACILHNNTLTSDHAKLHTKANINHFSFSQNGMLVSEHESILFEICNQNQASRTQEQAVYINNIGQVSLITNHHCNKIN